MTRRPGGPVQYCGTSSAVEPRPGHCSRVIGAGNDLPRFRHLAVTVSAPGRPFACASCHQAHGLGHAVGPDLSAEFQRAEETIIRDVLAPSDTISPGYVTYTVATEAGQVFSGLLVAESPTSLTLRQAEGKEQVVLRKDVDEVRALAVSMMPEDLPKTVAPRDLADLLSWLRRPPTSLILVDENRELIEAL